MNYALPYRPTTLMDRLRWKLFPVEMCETPDIPAKDCVITRTVCKFSFGARLKILFSGRIEVETKNSNREPDRKLRNSVCLLG